MTRATTTPEIRRIRLDAEQWSAAIERLRRATGVRRDAEGPGPIEVLARHAVAPVRARIVSAAGSKGAAVRLSIVGDEVLLILQATARDGERTRVGPGAELLVCEPRSLWTALRTALPPVDALRAGAGDPDNTTDRPPPSATEPDGANRTDLATGALDTPEPLPGETARLLVAVEAWPTPGQPAAVWMKRWSVADGSLFEIIDADGPARRPRPAGSVAAELQWALAGAVDVAGSADDGSPANVAGPGASPDDLGMPGGDPPGRPRR